MAVSLRGGGLVAPALHDADTRSLDDLMRGFRDLVTRARAGRLRGSELSDPTITMTSLGERGVEEVYGVIVPPQVAIVGFGTIVERPWVFQGRVLPCPVITVTVAADHRVTDGHRGRAVPGRDRAAAAGAGCPVSPGPLERMVLDALGEVAPEADLEPSSATCRCATSSTSTRWTSSTS